MKTQNFDTSVAFPLIKIYNKLILKVISFTCFAMFCYCCYNILENKA